MMNIYIWSHFKSVSVIEVKFTQRICFWSHVNHAVCWSFLSKRLRNCLSLVIPFRYATISEDACRGYGWRHKLYGTLILSRYFWVSVFLCLCGDDNTEGGSTHPGFSDLVMFTVTREKFRDQQEYAFFLSFLTHINLQLLFLRHFLFFGFSSYYLNFNFVINGTCVGQIDYIIFTIYVVFYDGVR